MHSFNLSTGNVLNAAVFGSVDGEGVENTGNAFSAVMLRDYWLFEICCEEGTMLKGNDCQSVDCTFSY